MNSEKASPVPLEYAPVIKRRDHTRAASVYFVGDLIIGIVVTALCAEAFLDVTLVFCAGMIIFPVTSLVRRSFSPCEMVLRPRLLPFVARIINYPALWFLSNLLDRVTQPGAGSEKLVIGIFLSSVVLYPIVACVIVIQRIRI